MTPKRNSDSAFSADGVIVVFNDPVSKKKKIYEPKGVAKGILTGMAGLILDNGLLIMIPTNQMMMVDVNLIIEAVEEKYKKDVIPAIKTLIAHDTFDLDLPVEYIIREVMEYKRINDGMFSNINDNEGEDYYE